MWALSESLLLFQYLFWNLLLVKPVVFFEYFCAMDRFLGNLLTK